MGLRLRLLALVGLISLPLVALVVHVTLDDYERAEARSRRQIQRVAATVVHEEAEIVERARHLMTALAELPIVRERRHDACAVLLARLLAEYKVYATLGVTFADGQVVCSAPAAPPGTTLADRPIFARAQAAGGVIVGEYAVGRLSGKPSLGLGFAVNDAKGQLQALVFGSLDLGWLPELLARVELMAGTRVTLLDRNGVVFARLPHAEGWVGRNVRDSAIVRALGDRQRVTEALADLDGRARIFAICRLESVPSAIVQGHLYLIGEHIGEEHRVQGIRDAVKRITEILARMTRITRLRHDDLSPASIPMLDIRESSDPDDPAPR